VKVVDVETFPAIPQTGKISLQSPVSESLLGSWQKLREQAERISAQLQTAFSSNLIYRKAYAAAAENNPAEYSNADKELRMIYTTEPALAFTFSGLSQEAVVEDVLRRLKKIDSKATFFVSELELRQNPRLVRKIIDQGHEVGLSVRPREGSTIEQVRKVVRGGLDYLKSQVGVSARLIKQPVGVVAPNTIRGVTAEGAIMIGQSLTVVQTKHKDYTSAQQVMSEIFPSGVLSLTRGQIVHFRLDFYSNVKLAGEVMDAIKREKIDNIAFSTNYDSPSINPANDSQYFIKPVGKILGNKMFLYRYPVELSSVPEHLRREGPAYADVKQRIMELVSRYYIGSPFVNEEDRIMNFSRSEIRRLDKTGLIQTNDPVIFLTFDDWGWDESINKLLYVLRKHDVYGTFFIITRSVLNNPNLLRTIAAEGNEIANHTDMHRPMVYINPQTGRQTLFQSSKEEYLQELKQSYKKLLEVTGDVVVDGKYSLTRYFRPPQLAINKFGLEAVFEAGFDYVVSGYYSTEDYVAQDTAALIKRLLEGVYDQQGRLQKGSILVMHMSATSPYTPIALDILLTANAAKADTDPTKFKVGRLSDYLTNGYIQKSRNRQPN
jgi:peptidoglycan/xylan/chitin deacetylase (PgdA/CDA1 family)